MGIKISIETVTDVVCECRSCACCPLHVPDGERSICWEPDETSEQILSALNNWIAESKGVLDDELRNAFIEYNVAQEDFLQAINYLGEVDFL